jgi:phenylalanyl-tRNA synthetase beta chain
MKVSLNWLKEYLDLDLSPEKVSEILTDIGLEVEGVEEVESVPGGLEGLVIGEVVECGQHPNADRLSLTKVSVGSDELLSIVCGAPNVAAGQKVVVATIGTTLYPTEGDPFNIKKGKIRGEVSEGMICAEDEIGLGTDHDGIIVLPDEAPVGKAAAEYYEIEKDIVYEIGLTPNRSDATSHLGVARDLAAALKVNYGHSGEVRVPVADNFVVSNTDHPVEVIVENTEACPRYAGLTVTGLQVGESPEWLRKRLRAIGVRPINNVVDITNFVLHEWGQPLHAFDLNAIKGKTIRVKTLPEKTVFKSLDEQDRKLTAQDLMICNGDSEGMCMAGVFGGLHSGVTEETTSIFLESAHFDAKYIRRTSMHHLLRTDAAKVFEKGSDPNIVVDALKRAAQLLVELAGGTISSEVVDVYPSPILPLEITFSQNDLNILIGVELDREKELKPILAALEMEIRAEEGDQITVAVPTNKSDVLRPVDVFEEVLRIYGLNQVPMPSHLKSSLSFGQHPDPRQIKNAVGDLLAANGFNEIMAVSMSESRYHKDILPVPEDELVFVNNTSNVHLDIMRPSMLMTGLEAVLHNQNRQSGDLKLFEYGRTYRREEGSYRERQYLSLFMTGKRWPENWHFGKDQEVTFYSLKAAVEQVMQRLGLDGYQESAMEEMPFAYALKFHRGPQELVRFGLLQRSILKGMDIKQPVFYAEFAWGTLLKALRKHKIHFTDLNKFPTVRRDLALVVDNSVKFSDIVSIARKTGKKLLRDINLFDVYDNEEQLGKGKKSYAVSFVFEDPTKTLKDKEVDKVMSQLIQQCEQKLGALIRK